MDIDTLVAELRWAKDNPKCFECKRHSECYKEIGCVKYCWQLIKQACYYLKDDKLRCLIESCMSGELSCMECKIDDISTECNKSCKQYMIEKVYERLSLCMVN